MCDSLELWHSLNIEYIEKNKKNERTNETDIEKRDTNNNKQIIWLLLLLIVLIYRIEANIKRYFRLFMRAVCYQWKIAYKIF